MKTTAGACVPQHGIESDAGFLEMVQDADAVHQVERRIAGVSGEVVAHDAEVARACPGHVLFGHLHRRTEVDTHQFARSPGAYVGQQAATSAAELNHPFALDLGSGERGEPLLELGCAVNRTFWQVVPRGRERIGGALVGCELFHQRLMNRYSISSKPPTQKHHSLLHASGLRFAKKFMPAFTTRMMAIVALPTPM